MISDRPATVAVARDIVLVGRLAVPAGARAGVVICHPHPLYGGDMDNPVVVRVAEVCRQLGLATLRFNFRGVGASTGQHGQGRDERHDVTAALAHFASVLPSDAPLGLAGYSFGAAVAARVAGERAEAPPLTAVALVAPPVAMTGDEPFAGLP